MSVLVGYTDSDFDAFHSLDLRPDPSAFSMHLHDRYELLFFIRGDACFYVEGTAYSLEPGSLLMMQYGESHMMRILSDKPYERICIHFHERALSAADPSGALLRPINDRPLGQGNLLRPGRLVGELFYAALPNHADTRCPARVRLTANLLAILSTIELDCQGNGGSVSADSRSGAGQANAIAAYLNDHLGDPLTLDAVAKEFYLSKSQLSRIFKAHTGSTIGSYLMVKRLHMARRLILDGMSAASASAYCGFHDYSAFYRAYKKRFDCTPSEMKNGME